MLFLTVQLYYAWSIYSSRQTDATAAGRHDELAPSFNRPSNCFHLIKSRQIDLMIKPTGRRLDERKNVKCDGREFRIYLPSQALAFIEPSTLVAYERTLKLSAGHTGIVRWLVPL